MIPYIAFIFVILLLYRLKKPILMAIVITVFAVIRFDTGWDYDSYYQVCIDSSELEIAKLAWGWLWGVWFEFCFEHKIPFVGIGVPAVLTTIVVYMAFRMLYSGEKKGINDAMLIYSLWPFLYLFSFCTVRQSLAIGIVMLAFVCVYKKKYKIALLLYVLNYFIHPSSVFTLLFLLFMLLKKRLNVSSIIVGSIATVIAFKFVSIILERFGMMGYLSLLESSDNFGGKIVIVYLALTLYYLYVISINKDTESIFAKMTSLAAIGCLLQFFVYVTDVPSVVSRACSYTYIFMAPTLLYSLKQIKLQSMKSLVIITVAAFFLVYLLITQNADGASSQYVPYKTIFSQL